MALDPGKLFEKLAATGLQLKKIVGFVIAGASLFSIILNISVAAAGENNTSRSSTLPLFVCILTAMAVIGLVSAFGKSPVGEWLQIAVFYCSALLAALTTSESNLTSGLFIIFGVILTFEYRLGSIAYWISFIFSVLVYPLSLYIGLRRYIPEYVTYTVAILFMILCLIVLYGSVILRHELRHRQDKELLEARVKERTVELETALEERSAALQEVHHRVKNNLQIVTSILQLEAGREEGPEARSSREKIQKRIYAMAAVHELLYREGNLDLVDLGRYVLMIVDEFRSGSSASYAVEAEDRIMVVLDFAVPFGLHVNELVGNARDHAFQDGRGGRVEIRLRVEGSGQVELVVSDDGAGLPEGLCLDGAKTLGINLVATLVAQLKGKIELDRGAGTRWTVSFPYAGA